MGKDLKGKELGEGLSQRKSDGLYMGRYKGKCVYGKTLKECKASYVELVNSVKTGTFTDKRKVKLDDYFKEWLQIRHDTKAIKESSERYYSLTYYAYISPVFGAKHLESITVTEVKHFQADLLKTRQKRANNKMLKPSSINGIMILFSQVMKCAVKDELLLRNPIEAINPLKKDKQTKATDTIHRALTIEEQRLFMEYAKDSWYYNLIDLLLRTGIRSGEAAGLRWSDIDYNSNVIHIRRTASVDSAGKLKMNTPKTETSLRDIPLRSDIRQIFVRQKEQLKMVHGKIVAIDDYVFKSVYDNEVTRGELKYTFDSILSKMRKAGIEIEHFTPHALRDTFATRAIESGMNPQTLKTILGHSSLSMTMDLYAHVLPNTKQEEMQKIADAF